MTANETKPLSDDEVGEAIAALRQCIVAPGWRYELVMCMAVKAWLAQGLSPGDALEHLEALNRSQVAPHLAALPALTDVSVNMVDEANRFSLADPNDENGEAAFRMLTRDNVFWALVKMNPGVLPVMRALFGDRRL